MKTILQLLIADRELFLHGSGVSGYRLFRYTDGTLGCVESPRGLTAESQKPTVAGLRRLLAWVDHCEGLG